MFQGLLITLSLFKTVNHFQLEIKIMIDIAETTVPRCITEPGGTITVTIPTLMACIMMNQTRHMALV